MLDALSEGISTCPHSQPASESAWLLKRAGWCWVLDSGMDSPGHDSARLSQGSAAVIGADRKLCQRQVCPHQLLLPRCGRATSWGGTLHMRPVPMAVPRGCHQGPTVRAVRVPPAHLQTLYPDPACVTSSQPHFAGRLQLLQTLRCAGPSGSEGTSYLRQTGVRVSGPGGSVCARLVGMGERQAGSIPAVLRVHGLRQVLEAAECDVP